MIPRRLLSSVRLSTLAFSLLAGFAAAQTPVTLPTESGAVVGRQDMARTFLGISRSVARR